MIIKWYHIFKQNRKHLKSTCIFEMDELNLKTFSSLQVINIYNLIFTLNIKLYFNSSFNLSFNFN